MHRRGAVLPAQKSHDEVRAFQTLRIDNPAECGRGQDSDQQRCQLFIFPKDGSWIRAGKPMPPTQFRPTSDQIEAEC